MIAQHISAKWNLFHFFVGDVVNITEVKLHRVEGVCIRNVFPRSIPDDKYAFASPGTGQQHACG